MNTELKTRIEELKCDNALFKAAADAQEIVWINPKKEAFEDVKGSFPLGMEDILDAEERLHRFAPLIMACFKETEETQGIIESPLTEIEKMKQDVNPNLPGRLYVKRDSDLPIAGSVKARGGIYEVLKHTEELAIVHGLIKEGESYDKLVTPENRAFFSQYKVQVGSTGNLGMSIGIMSAAIGYQAIVHMSADAKQWKKDLLRSHGVTVVEYPSDYGAAVKEGRALSDADPTSYFVDDENSKALFLGYAVAALRLRKQFEERGIRVDSEHPLFAYLPCGVGGAPGGIAFGLKQVFGDATHCFFVEPVQAPAMLIGMMSGLHSGIEATDIGLSGKTEADGLAVGRPSGFVGGVMDPLLSGEFTLQDSRLCPYMKRLLELEGLFLEPSACAMFVGPEKFGDAAVQEYIKAQGLADRLENATHLVWATGGRLVPEAVREEYLQKA